MRAEMNQRRDGGPARDLSSFSEWRQGAAPDNLDLLDMYESLLVGQFAGMGNALSLEAVIAAFRIDGIPRAEWSERARRLVLLHGLWLERAEKDAK